MTCYNVSVSFETRPWGNYTVLQEGENYQVKRLVINPGKRISLQSHQFRAEHWFIVSGAGIAEVDGVATTVKPGDSVDIPVGLKHRISCSDIVPLTFIEVQTGTSFSETDITRFEDDFGRS
jgi:mannose-6-phosphate isomerase-like protein (cupin superfamily)